MFAFVYQAVEEFFNMFSYPIGQIMDSIIHVQEAQKPTIIIVERWFSTNGLHKLWVNYLVGRGYGVHMINFPIQEGTFEQSATKLKDYINAHNLHNLILVGISGGGITAFLYLQHHGGWEKVRKFISIGTPFQGTPMALFISFVKGAAEELPGSRLLQKLNMEPILHPEKITCLAAKFDELVPKKSSLLPQTRHVIIDVFGHNNFHLSTKKTYDTVAQLAEA